jgi:L-asparaginase II
VIDVLYVIFWLVSATTAQQLGLVPAWHAGRAAVPHISGPPTYALPLSSLAVLFLLLAWCAGSGRCHV